MVSLTDAEAGIRQWIAEQAARTEAVLRDHLPAIHDAAVTLEKMSKSPIISEVMQLADVVLPPETEQAIVTLIRGAGEAAAKIAAVTGAAPAEPVGLDADQVPGAPAEPQP